MIILVGNSFQNICKMQVKKLYADVSQSVWRIFVVFYVIYPESADPSRVNRNGNLERLHLRSRTQSLRPVEGTCMDHFLWISWVL